MSSRIHEILLRTNLPHVVYVKNRNGDLEEVDHESPINKLDVLRGMAELNKQGIVLLDIRAGVSKEGITKISSVDSAGLYENNKWITEPLIPDTLSLPEGDSGVIPFKSDSWALGEYLIGKRIPRRFMKSQNLLDTFCANEDELVKSLLILNPEKRPYTWDVAPSSSSSECSLM